MSNRGEMWVHGNSVVVQYPGGEGLSPFTISHRMLYAPNPDRPPTEVVPWSDLLGARSIYGATFRGAFGDQGGLYGVRSTNYFHFSIPTPAFFPRPDVADHRKITVDKVSVYYSTANEHIRVTGIYVTGGGSTQGVGLSDPGGLHGTHTGQEDRDNAWMLPRPITMGLGRDNSVLVSVLVDFGVIGEITFTAAAIHYSVS